jgi:hypothetical protein
MRPATPAIAIRIISSSWLSLVARKYTWSLSQQPKLNHFQASVFSQGSLCNEDTHLMQKA